MDFNGFINRDVRPIKAVGWIDARNILLSKGFKSVSNEVGFDLYIRLVNGVSKDYLDMDIIGIICAGLDIIVFSTNNIYSEIGIVNGNGNYRTIIRSTPTTVLGITYNLFNFNRSRPIRGIFRRNFNDEIEVAFTDDNETPKIINLTKLPVNLTPTYELVDVTKFTLLELFPEIDVPNFGVTNVNLGGGNILAGAYYFYVCYEIDYYNLTNWVGGSRPVIIGQELLNFVSTAVPKWAQSTVHYFFSMGEDANTYDNSEPFINKSISLLLTGLDTRYEFYRLGIIHKGVNGVIKAAEVGRFPVTQTNVTYGGTKLRDLSLEEVIVPTISYPKIKDFVGFNNELLALNCKTHIEFNYQKYANFIKVKYGTTDLTATGGTEFPAYYNTGKRIFDVSGMMPDEVEALYITFIRKDGTHTQSFHIPGRAERQFTDSLGGTFNEGDGLGVYTHVSAQEAGLINWRYFHTRNTADYNLNPTNELGFWENQDDYYPNTDDFDVVDASGVTPTTSIRGQRIRHHRMPDVNKMYNMNVGFTSQYTSTIPPLSTTKYLRKSLFLSIEDVFVPSDLKDQVQSWYISYAKKDSKNSVILGSGLLTNSRPKPSSYIDRNARFYNFGLQTIKPSLIGTYAKTVYGTYAIGTGGLYGGALEFSYELNRSDGAMKFKRTEYDNVYNIDGVKYYPSDNAATAPNNEGREDYINIIFKAPCPFINLANNGSYDVDYGQYWYVTNICSHFLNIHNPFFAEKLVSTGKVFDINTSAVTPLYGGDCVFDTQPVLRIARPGEIDVDAAIIGYYYMAYTRHNINFRKAKEYQPIDTDQTPPTPPVSPYFYNNLDSSFYSLTFNSIQDLIPESIFEPLQVFTNKLPYRIARSNNSGLEAKINNWRTFLANRYYEMPKNKGKIWCGAVSNKNLYIQMERSLFVSDIKDSLKTGTTDVYIASSDIFERLPSEAIGLDNGYIGCRSMWGTCVTKYGYVVVDVEQGKVFVIGNDLQEISKNGLFQFFDKNLDLNSTADNPFTQVGITVAFDDENDRLLLTKSASHKGSFTVAYSFANKGWSDFHDYIPDLLFFNKEGLFSVKNRSIRKEIYRHNSELNYATFYKDDVNNIQEVFSSYIDVIFNWQEETVLQDIQWETEVINNLGAVLYDKTATHIMIYNENQCSGIINLKDNRFINNRNKVKTWNFNDFRDIVIDKSFPFLNDDGSVINNNINTATTWFKQNKFTGKFAIVRIIYDNSSQNRLYLNDIRVNVSANEV
jgi:hypothetical protein